jgi:hypothetical protein
MFAKNTYTIEFPWEIRTGAYTVLSKYIIIDGLFEYESGYNQPTYAVAQANTLIILLPDKLGTFVYKKDGF